MPVGSLSVFDSTTVLIDTWWNVNFFQTLKLPVQLLVLIDTWWNVNKKLFNLSFTPFVVLIDTWWNVNINCKVSFSGSKEF